MVNFRLNKAAIDKLARDVTRQAGAELEKEFAALSRQYKGRSLDEAKAALRRMFQKRGGKVTDSELTAYAEQLVAGRSIKVVTH